MMILCQKWGTGLMAAVLWLTPAVFATECTFEKWQTITYQMAPSGTYNQTKLVSIYVYSQEDLDARTANCTTLIGSMWVGANYTGRLVLKGITNITGPITTVNGAYWSPPVKNRLTSIEMPDLITMDGLLLDAKQPVDLVSFPKVKSASSLIEIASEGTGVTPNISFPALVDATEILIVGETLAMDFTSLRNVSSSLKIKGSSSDALAVASPKKNAVRAINFPNLRTAGVVSFVGNLSDISVPLLEEMVTFPYQYWSGSGFNVANSGQMLNVTAPKLRNTTVLSLQGQIGRFSFPSLINLDGDLMVDTTILMNISVAPLKTAASITLKGNLTGYDLSSLRGVKNAIRITSNSPTFDCAPAKSVWYNTSRVVNITNTDSSSSYTGFVCYYPAIYVPEKVKKTLPKDAKIGIALGIGLSALILLCLWNCRRQAKAAEKKKMLLPPPAYALGDRAVERRRSEDVEGEALPGYAPRGVTAPVTAAEAERLATVEAGEPPGYDSHLNAVDTNIQRGAENGEPGRISDTLRRETARRE